MNNDGLNQVIFCLKNSFDLNRDLNHPDLNRSTLGMGFSRPCNLTASLPCDASAERGDATVSRLSVCPSVTIRYRVQISWNSSKIISRPNSLRPMRSLTPNTGDLVQREHPQN